MITGNEPINPKISSDRGFVDGIVQYGYTKINQTGGLTIRQYFAANAPDIPDWFKHTPIPELKLTTREKEVYEQYSDLSPHLQSRVEEDIFNSVSKRKYEWHIQNSQARYFQWRIFFAESLIAELNKEK